MPTRFRKTRKQRGSIFHGKGRVGKKRCHESGRGNAGGAHMHRINMDKYHPGYFGKLGMRHYHMTKNKYWKPTINLDQVSKLIPADQAAKAKKGEALPVVDLRSHGYAKLMGRGECVPCVIKCRYVSEKAEAKISKLGGAVVLQA
jgi:large subunit ribosomal protein L27Ae